MNNRMIHLLCLISISCLGGCTAFRHVEVPKSTPTMHEIYQSHFEQHGILPSNQTDLAIFEDQSELASQTVGEVETAFPVLENPMLIMYVFPHLVTEEKLPVPGYWTAFPMYERTEFAEPGDRTVKKSEGN